MTSSQSHGTGLPRERRAIVACDLLVPLAAMEWDDVQYVAFAAASMANQADLWAGHPSRALLEARMIAGRAAAAVKRIVPYDELDAALVLARRTRPAKGHCELIDESVEVAWKMARQAAADAMLGLSTGDLGAIDRRYSARHCARLVSAWVTASTIVGLPPDTVVYVP